LRNSCNSAPSPSYLLRSFAPSDSCESHFYLALQTFACEMHLKFSTYLPHAAHSIFSGHPAFKPCARDRVLVLGSLGLGALSAPLQSSSLSLLPCCCHHASSVVVTLCLALAVPAISLTPCRPPAGYK